MATRTLFDWDPAKAASNLAKQEVSFDDAVSVFADPLAVSIPDRDHGSAEERWVAIGLSRGTNLLLVVHTHVELDADLTYIRVISARKPNKRERRQYNNSPDKRDDDMKDDYDFTGGVRGKFFRAGAALVPPVHLEPDVLAYLQARATARGTSLSALVNDLLKHDIALIETGR